LYQFDAGHRVDVQKTCRALTEIYSLPLIDFLPGLEEKRKTNLLKAAHGHSIKLT
jgi:hypothetical protein